MTEQITTAYGYVRVSTSRQADSGLSIEAQHAKIKAAAELNDFNLQEIIVDAGESGKNMDRPGMIKLMGLIDRGQVDVLVVAKLDRITRSTADLARLIDMLRTARRADGARGVDFVSTSESLDTSSAAGRLVLNILGVVAQWEREAIVERTVESLRAKKARGESCGNVSFGYVKLEDGKMAVNPQEQAVLDDIRRFRSAGLSWAKVAAEINGNGHRTRGGRPFCRQGLNKIAFRAGLL